MLLYLALFLGGAGFGLGGLAFYKSHLNATILNDIKTAFEDDAAAVVTKVKAVL